jgi:hypothetical protein
VHLSTLQKKGEGISWHYERRRGASLSITKEGRGTILSTTSKEMCIFHILYQEENMTTSTAREGEVHLPATTRNVISTAIQGRRFQSSRIGRFAYLILESAGKMSHCIAWHNQGASTIPKI